MSEMAAALVFEEIERSPDLLFCAASGGSPTGLYEHMVKKYSQEPDFFSELNVIKLDEWVGLPKGSEFSSEADIQKKLLKPIQYPVDRYISFDDQTTDPQEECERIQGELEEKGPVGICILGLGVNGHLALNEPGEFLQSYCHVAKLSPTTLSSGMIEKVGLPLSEGMTLGMGNIFESHKVILFITGKGKREIVEQFLTKKITNELPASLLWLHPNATVYMDEEVLK